MKKKRHFKNVIFKKLTENNKWKQEKTDLKGVSRKKTEFFFNNTIKVLLENEKMKYLI